ncbi:MAG: hypothetical protein IPO58_19390 [Betaproteobacteria bacterium]|nr:hypothetical protein [Betaproteobacteria bacterium]
MTSGNLISGADLYDPSTNSWSFAGNMSGVRHVHTATLLGNGSVLVAGGLGNGTIATAEIFTPTAPGAAPSSCSITQSPNTALSPVTLAPT